MDTAGQGADAAPRFDYEGDEALRGPVTQALRRVVDPEVALSIVDVGLIYRVRVTQEGVHVLMTMTSAACPVTDVIVEDVQDELDRVLPAALPLEVEITYEPPWTPERMSESARRFMRW
ncbi:metal-sulfur cluster assembly factor [Azohydromonas lata]|uniref:Metal-sulfur cluster assembly factor n=1 Tax=Azohydromonas lata TaxID=45677 RepID=A0ABU5IFM3_9BURK|nr:metal-sulfur cluster assembly factor [Azohydromonas lata]MDZ5457748.1 metal-sulfur cluster assembly factor [Azohydromonas lata]